MSHLFSSFDPSSFLNINVNWVSMCLFIFLVPSIFWTTFNQSSAVTMNVVSSVSKEFNSIMSPNSNPGMLLFPLSLLIFIVSNNFLGLFPYVFTASSHLTFSVSMALSLWVGHMCLAASKVPGSMLAHLVPTGTPTALIPLMVIIELVSSSIRPLTLSVRLAANMIAGHLLLALLGNQDASSSLSLISIVLSLLILLCILETAVSLIQAYVFSVLSTLYINEVNSSEMK